VTLDPGRGPAVTPANEATIRPSDPQGDPAARLPLRHATFVEPRL